MSLRAPPSKFEEQGLSALKETIPHIHEALLDVGAKDWTLDDVTDAVGAMWHVNCEEHMKNGVSQGLLRYCWLLLKDAIEFICK